MESTSPTHPAGGSPAKIPRCVVAQGQPKQRACLHSSRAFNAGATPRSRKRRRCFGRKSRIERRQLAGDAGRGQVTRQRFLSYPRRDVFQPRARTPCPHVACECLPWTGRERSLRTLVAGCPGQGFEEAGIQLLRRLTARADRGAGRVPLPYPCSYPRLSVTLNINPARADLKPRVKPWAARLRDAAWGLRSAPRSTRQPRTQAHPRSSSSGERQGSRSGFAVCHSTALASS